MLEITVRVSKNGADAFQLVQIHELTAVNKGHIGNGLHTYQIYVDGKRLPNVVHDRDDGALVLCRKILERVTSMPTEEHSKPCGTAT